jgi:hypothetical protein
MTETNVNPIATETLIDIYFEMWRTAEEAQRAELVGRAFTPDGRHVDPMADAVGHDEIAHVVAGVHATYPGFTIERTSGIDQHGDQLRFTWRLDAADGSPIVTGLDVAELAPDGRLSRVASFWGELPEA